MSTQQCEEQQKHLKSQGKEEQKRTEKNRNMINRMTDEHQDNNEHTAV